MALARALTGAVRERSHAFEALEPRALLTAPTISGSIGQATMSELHFAVHYIADPADPIMSWSPVVGVTGPNGFSQLAQLYQPGYRNAPIAWTSDGAGGDWGQYVLYSPQGFFDNGTYTIGVAAGSVRTAHGDVNAAGGAGQTYLWFPDSAYGGSGGDNANNQLRVSFERWDRNAPAPAAGVANIRTLELTRPDGQVVSLDMTPSDNTTSSRVHIAGNVYFDAPGGTWDFSDNGTYTVRAPVFGPGGVRTGSVLVAQYYLWFGPRVDLLSSQFTSSMWSLSVRFTGAQGIDLSSIQDSNSYFAFGDSDLGDQLVSGAGRLAAAPIVNADGTVDATYVYYPGPQGFTAAHNGQARASIFGVRGSGGDYMYGQTLDRRTINSTTPTVVSVNGNAVTSHSWTITTRVGSRGIDQSAFTADDLRIEGPNGTILTPTGVSATFDDTAYRVTYTLVLPAGQHLANGQYRVFLRAGAVTVNGQASSEVMLGSWWLWF
jgi:hypothetical protein